MFQVHKPGQGKFARTATLLAGLFFVAWAARSLLITLPPRIHATLGLSWNEILLDASPSDAWQADWATLLFALDDDGCKLSPALTAALLLLAVGGFAFWRWLNRPAVADRLIDMESELHKVSWPSFGDAWQSTLVVSGFTALIIVLVFTFDVVIKGVMDLMPVQRGGS